jgi:GWxTD domain-containing protein
MKITILLALIIAIVFNNSVYAQNSQDNRNSNKENIFFESITFPSNDSADSNTVYLLYKIRLSELNFDKSDNIKLNSFSAYPVFDIEIKDNTGIIRKRIHKNDTVTIEDYSLLNRQDQYYNGVFKTKLSAIDYSINFLITVNNIDIYNKRTSLAKSQKNNLQIVGNPVLVNLESGTEAKYIPSITNNTINLKFPNPALIMFTSPSKRSNLSATITYVPDSGNPLQSYPLTYNAKVVNIDNKGIDCAKIGNTIKGLLVNNQNSAIYQIDIPNEMVYPGNFNLLIIDRSKKDTLKYEYKVQWIDKPSSLEKRSTVQEVMSYILTDDEIREFKNSKKEDQFLYNYWQKLDPTPQTYYNEAMNAYFTRVDEAKTKFATIYHADGALTQRGKIYILFGQPDTMLNELKESKPIERWEYKKLKKQFIFEITTPGEYKLIQIIE